ncbi:MAG TPA: flagellin [Acidobacteriaceae bacterium]|jgi:flagellin|nr:flagellin [Acidobacteriaceae bacterium]
MISVLNNVSSLVAENALSATQASLQTTLQQLSTGVRINSGSQDPAGLSIANGLGANIAALTQSSQNASNGVGLLQTADGALSQVTSLLNQAVTIATEAANGGLTGPQSTAADKQFQSILAAITSIGSTTNFNGTAVFSATPQTVYTGDGTSTDNVTTSTTTGVLSAASLNLGGGDLDTSTNAAPVAANTVLTSGSVTTIKNGGVTLFSSTASGTSTVGDLMNQINASGVGTATLNASGQLAITGVTTGDIVATGDTKLGAATEGTAVNFTNTPGASLDLTTTADAKTALAALTAAVSTVAQSRGTIGAAVNVLTADVSVQNTEVQNLTSAQNNVQNADIGKTVANMTQYNVLEQTGMAAMSQSNQAQQAVLKLLQ